MLLERCPKCNKLYPGHHKVCPVCSKPPEVKKSETKPLDPKTILSRASKTSKISLSEDSSFPMKPSIPAVRPTPPATKPSAYIPPKPASSSRPFAFPQKDRPKQINYVPYSLEGVGIQCATCGKYSPTDKNFCVHCGNSFM